MAKAVLYWMGMHGLRQFHLPVRLLLTIGACVSLLSGCDQPPATSQPSSSAMPQTGFGQRLGTDVTTQPGRSSAAVQPELSRIVAFGNSLTAGLGVAQGESYPSQLAQRLAKEGFRYRVINAGVSGETTAGGLRRVSWILQSRPQIVILELGANDGLRGLRVEETQANLERIIEQLTQANVAVVLAGMKMPPNYGADYTTRFEAIYPALAKKYRIPLIPFFLDKVAGVSSLNQADGIHPTADGYRLIVGTVLEALVPLLDKGSS